MTPPLGIVAAQIAPAPWDVETTLDDYEAYVRHVVRSLSGVRLIVHPELYLSAYGPFEEEAPAHWSQEAVAEPVPGPLTERLCALARELDVWLVPGSIFERGEEERVHNTALAISPATARSFPGAPTSSPTPARSSPPSSSTASPWG
jgi:formamidase